MLTVHGRATSLNVQAVMWLARRARPARRAARPRLPLRRHRHPRIPRDEPERPRPDPRQDEHVTLFESAAILRYLAARHARFPFWPEDPVARAPVDMWAEWGKTTLQPSFVGPVWFPLLLGRAGPGDPAWDKARAGFETQARHPRGPARSRTPG